MGSHLYIDETEVDDYRSFAMAAVFTDDPERLVLISNELRKNWEEHSLERYGVNPEKLTNKIPKYSGSPPHVKRKVLKESKGAGVMAYGAYIDGNADDNPRWWASSGANDVQRRTLSKLLDIAFRDIEEIDVTVVLEQHDAYLKGRGEEIVLRRAKALGKNACALVESSKTGAHRAGLHIADFATGALGRFVSRGNTDEIKIIGMKHERIRV